MEKKSLIRVNTSIIILSLQELSSKQQMDLKILPRHENVSRRIKSFDFLSETFRHDLSLHRVFFHAVANIVQIGIENGEKLPDVSY